MRHTLLMLVLLPFYSLAFDGWMIDENYNMSAKDGRYLCFVRSLPHEIINMDELLKTDVIAFADVTITSINNDGKNVHFSLSESDENKRRNMNLPFIRADGYTAGYGITKEKNETNNIYGMTVDKHYGPMIIVRENKGFNFLISDCKTYLGK